MRQQTNEMFIFKAGALPQVTFTMSSTSTVTATAHGYSVGDTLQFTTTTTLPSGLSLATNYYVIAVLTANTFQISATPNGTKITTTDAGTGTHTCNLIGKKICIADFRQVEIGAFTTGSSNSTIKIQISNQETVDFGKAASSTNRWSYVQLKELLDSSTKDGGTGIATTGTDIAKSYEVNINGNRYLSANFTAYSAGTINLTCTCFGGN